MPERSRTPVHDVLTQSAQSSQRTHGVLFSAVSALIVVSAVPALAQTPTGNWSQFRGTPQLLGVAADAPPAALTLRWTHQGADGVDSSPAIADGSVYAASGNGDLLAIDLASGKLRWKYATGGMIGESSPAVGGGAAFIGDLGGVVHAVNVRDGTRLWTFKTGSEIKSSPTLVGGVVLIGSYDTHLYALDARTGKLRWKLQTDGPVHATPAVLNGTVYVTGCDENFRAVRVADGQVLFKIPTGAYTGASPVIDGERAYFGTFNYEVLAVDLRARKIVWRYSNPERSFPFYSSAALVDGRVILGGRDKSVHAIDAKSGKAAWAFATRARVDSSPVVAAGRVYVGSSDGRLYVLDAATGAKQWEFDAGAGITASPAVAAGRVVIAAQDGRIYCFG
jgi:outer membrane protein assembly factor BamB